MSQFYSGEPVEKSVLRKIRVEMKKEFNLHSGRKGAALAVHVIPRARRNEIVEISRDGAIKIRLKLASDAPDLNDSLITFLTDVLKVEKARLEVVAGQASLSKLVSILDMDAREAHDRILENLS